MTEYAASTYGDQIAEVYDVLFREHDAAAIETLADLAGQGPVLELGIGTGRLALPLAERGVVVHGIDASPAMVVKLRSKLGGAKIPVTVGDFSVVTIDQRYSLVFVAFNTFFGLQTQEEQVRCFRHVASLLCKGGAFLIEAFVPDLGRFDRGQRLAVSRVDSLIACGSKRRGMRQLRRSLTLNLWRSRSRECASSQSASVTRGPQSSISWPKSPG